MSLRATILHPCACISRATASPTFPKPCTATRLPANGIPRRRAASRAAIMTPRPVASLRPTEPPIEMGFPVTTEDTE